MKEADRDGFLNQLSDKTIALLPFIFEAWAHVSHQLPPEGSWRTWVMLGGRGAGKTRAGAEWLRSKVEGSTPAAPGAARNVALIAETWEQAREVMVFGDSGLINCTPPDRRPAFIATRRKLVWPNGAEAQLYSASDPESLRGPQFDCAWLDELAKWRRAREAWDMLQFALRLGDAPQQMVTTTPRDVPLLHEILADPRTVKTSAPTDANRANLAPEFLRAVFERYGGTELGRQELGGELLTSREGALFTRASIEKARVSEHPVLDRIVIGVDPPVTSGAGSDACGIVVVGRAADAAYVLDDRSVERASPARWAAEAVRAWRDYDADRIVAEVNQGGDLVIDTIKRVDSTAPVSKVRATKGKAVRAEPVSLLYEQGRVRHVGLHPALEDELCDFELLTHSPDRADALVWAVLEAMGHAEPKARVRRL